MSFILDALKKSENERQGNAPAEFASVPSAPSSSAAPRWLWVLGLLLLVNIVLLAGTLASKSRHSSGEPPATSPARTDAHETVAAVAPSRENPAARDSMAFTDRVEQARRQLPERRAAAATTPPIGRASPDGAPRASDPAGGPASGEESPFAALPSLAELQANGTLQVPDLHVDIHVFSDNPDDRFVFINMNKYREQARLAEGPLVREITRDGVVLEENGTVFVLLRD